MDRPLYTGKTTHVSQVPPRVHCTHGTTTSPRRCSSAAMRSSLVLGSLGIRSDQSSSLTGAKRETICDEVGPRLAVSILHILLASG